MDGDSDLLLVRIVHPRAAVRSVGINAGDPYVERCWRPFLGPTATALLREVDRLAGPVGSPPTAIPTPELAAMLGLTRGDLTKTNNRLRRTLERTQQFGMGRWELANRTFELHEPLPLLSPRYAATLCERAPVAFGYHRAHLVELWDGLAQAGFDHPEQAPEMAEILAGLARDHPWLARQQRGLQRLDDVAQRSPLAYEPPAAAL